MRIRQLCLLLGLLLLGQVAYAQEPTPEAPGFTACLSERQLARAREYDTGAAAFRSSNVPAPPLLWLSSDRTFAMAGMLYWYHADVPALSKLQLLLPLLYAKCTPTQRSFGSWLFGYRRDAQGIAGFAGPVFYRRDLLARTNAFFPLYLYSNDQGHRTLTVLNFWHHETRDVVHGGIFPLAAWGDDFGKNRYRTVLPPLFWHSRHETHSLLITFPFYRKLRADGSWWSGVLPLYYGARDRHHQHDVLLPLFVRLRGHNWRAGLLGQSYWIDGPDRHSFGSFPFYFGYRDPRGGFADVVLPPLFVRRGDARQTQLWSLNTFWSRSRSGDYELVLFPLLVAKRERTLRSLYTPLGFRVADEHTSSTLLGTVYHTRNDAGAAHTGVMPLFAYGADAHHRYLALPLLLSGYGAERDRDRLVVGTFFLRRHPNGMRAGIPPLYIGARMNDRDYVDVVPPLAFGRWGDGERKGWIAGPLYARKGPSRRGWGLLPLYAQVRTPTHSFDLVTPSFASWRSSTKRVTTVFPLAAYSRTATRRRFWSPLLFSSADNTNGERNLTVPPLLWLRTSAEKQVGVLAPIWWRFHWKSQDERLGVLFPLGLRHDKQGERTTVALNTAFSRSRDRPGAWSFHFFPLLSLSHLGPDHTKWQLLTGLLGHEHDATRARWRLFWIWTEPS